MDRVTNPRTPCDLTNCYCYVEYPSLPPSPVQDTSESDSANDNCASDVAGSIMCMWCLLYHGSSLHSTSSPPSSPRTETVPLPKQGSNPGTPWVLEEANNTNDERPVTGLGLSFGPNSSLLSPLSKSDPDLDLLPLSSAATLLETLDDLVGGSTSLPETPVVRPISRRGSVSPFLLARRSLLPSSSEPQSPHSSEPPSPLSECSSLMMFASPKIPRSSTPIIECQLMDSPVPSFEPIANLQEYACAARRKYLLLHTRSESRFVRPQPTDETFKIEYYMQRTRSNHHQQSINLPSPSLQPQSGHPQAASEFGHSPGVDSSSANRDSFHVLSRDDRDPSRLRKPTGSRRQIRQRRRSTRP